MGSYLSAPVTEKNSEEGESENGLAYAVSSMQGWRTSMEDAHITELKAADDLSVFGVYDGHGGAEVALWVKRHYLEILKETPGFKAKDYRKALTESYFKVDDILATNEGRDELQKILDEYTIQEEEAEARRAQEMAEKGEAEGEERSGEDEDGEGVDIGSLPPKLQAILAAQMGIPLEDLVGEGEDEEEEVSDEEDEDDDKEETNEAKDSNDEKEENKKDEKEEKSIEDKTKSTVKKEDDDKEEKESNGKEGASGKQEEKEEDSDDDSEFDPDEVAGGVGYDSGCTAVTCLVVKNKLFVANVGDSRCIVSQAGKAKELTKDHSPEDKEEIARIEKAGGTIEDGRVNGNLNLTRALGDLTYKLDKDIGPEAQIITALPDIQSHELSKGDDFMVLACDGIWNVMSSQEVIDYVSQEMKKEESSLKEICEGICEKCLAKDTDNDGSGCDNMTIMIVRFNKGSPLVGQKRKAQSDPS